MSPAIGTGRTPVIGIHDLNTSSPSFEFGHEFSPQAGIHNITLASMANGTTILAAGISPHYVADNDEIWLWNVIERRLVGKITGVDGAVHNLLSINLRDGKSILAYTDSSESCMIRLWDLEDNVSLGEMASGEGWISAFAAIVSSRGSDLLAAASSDGIIRLWDATTGQLRGELAGHDGDVYVLISATMPDGFTFLISGGYDGVIRLWDPDAAMLVGELSGHTATVWALKAISMPNGESLLASASYDSTVALWDLARFTRQATLIGHTGSVDAVTTVRTPDGRVILVSAGRDATIILWEPVAKGV